tara:strand:- start:154 stop:573 length:420 start_codon:yes stop_codon:yes gene_type:complete
MISFFKKFSVIFVIGSTLVSCSGESLKKIGVKANISRSSGEEIVLKTIVTNYSEKDTKLRQIDISYPLHKELNLKRSDLSEGDCFFGVCSYYIERKISPGESLTINFNGNYIPSFISGEVDFVIDNLLNFKTVSVDCCK